MDTSKSIKDIYELIDTYKLLSILGNRMEIVVTPFEKSESGLDDSKRMITIGLQSGNTKDRMFTFVVDDAKTFDEKILPQILSYYTSGDEIEKWDTVVTTIADATNKAVGETKDGNLFYYETLGTPAIDRLRNRKKVVDEKTKYKKVELTDEEKIWDEILLYAKSRRNISDIFNGNSEYFLEDEMFNNIINLLNVEKGFSSSNKKASVLANEKLLKQLLDERDNKTLLDCGFSVDVIDRINDTSMIKRLAKVIGSTKRFKNHLDINNPEIMDKLHFAISELDKVDYYDKKNASIDEFEQGVTSNTKPTAIDELKQIVELNNANLNGEIVDKYIGYCDSILGYLNKKATNTRKVISSSYSNEQVSFEPFNKAIHNDYDKLLESIELCKDGRVEEEDFEITVEFDENNRNKRYVKVGLLNNMSKLDSFYFEFDNDENFDYKFIKDIKRLGCIDKFSPIGYIENSHFKDVIYDVNVEEQKERENPLAKGNLDNVLNNDEHTETERTQDGVPTPPENSNEEDSKKIEFNDYTASFEKLHEYALKYKIHNNNGPLVIINREDGSIYTPIDEHERDNIEFAYYWAVMAGVELSNGDAFVGEKCAFNSESEKLFNIVSLQFKESIKRGIEVDLDSIRDMFAVSDVPNAMLVYDGLFRNSFYLDYVNGYYSNNIVKNTELNRKEVSENEKISSIEELKKAISDSAKRQAKKLEEEQRIQASAEEEASRLLAEMKKNIKEAAKKQAQEIVEKDKIKASAEEEARLLNEKDKNAIAVAGEEQAKEIVENDKIKASAEEEASRLLAEMKKNIKEAAEEQAKEIVDSGKLPTKQTIEIPNVVNVVVNKIDENNNKFPLNDSVTPIVIENVNVILNNEEDVKKDDVIEIIEPSKDIDESIEEVNEESKEEVNDEVYESNNDETISKIREAYSNALEKANVDNPVIIKVHFDKNNKNVSEVIISSGNVSENEEVLYFEKFDSEYVMGTVLPELVSLYTENNAIVYNNHFSVPKPTSEGYTDVKCGLISLGSNDNCLQITNASSNCIEFFEKEINNAQNQQMQAKEIVENNSFGL